MVTMYVADGLRALLVSVEEFVEPSQQIWMRLLYVIILSIASHTVIINLFNHSVN